MFDEQEQMCLTGDKKGIDDLFASVSSYARSDRFMELLRFTAHFKSYAPYNGMLIHIQCPSARYVLPARHWRRYHRIVEQDKRPIVILQPFAPVAYVFDVKDTIVEQGKQDLFPPELAKPYDGDPDKTVTESLYARLIKRLKFWGIYFGTMVAGENYSGKIQTAVDRVPDLEFSEKSECPAKWRPLYLISANTNSTQTVQFCAILHELGHLFCRHIPSAYDKEWDVRSLSHEGEEFEAETVSWLVARRLGIDNPSYRYLAGYFMKHGSIPKDVSIDEILKATKLVEQVLYEMNPKECWLYKKSAHFKSVCDDLRAQNKVARQ